MLSRLDESKNKYIFDSISLIKLLDSTSSLKTKLKIVSMISPRLIDPNSKTEEILSLFRFSEDKKYVENALKDRAKNMNVSQFTKPSSVKSSILSGRGRGSGSIRGRGGRSLNNRKNDDILAGAFNEKVTIDES